MFEFKKRVPTKLITENSKLKEYETIYKANIQPYIPVAKKRAEIPIFFIMLNRTNWKTVLKKGVKNHCAKKGKFNGKWLNGRTFTLFFMFTSQLDFKVTTVGFEKVHFILVLNHCNGSKESYIHCENGLENIATVTVMFRNNPWWNVKKKNGKIFPVFFIHLILSHQLKDLSFKYSHLSFYHSYCLRKHQKS